MPETASGSHTETRAETGAEMSAEKYFRSTYAVWEVTLRCNLGCIHCGSRAGDARADELSLSEALDLVDQLAELDIREISLIGGEAFLRPDWLEIARAIQAHGIRLTMTTGGFGLGPKLAEQMADVGFSLVSVSVDGLQETHDFLRGKPKSWEWCFRAFEALQDAGIRVAANTQINRKNAPELPRLYEHLRDAGVRSWQTQLTVPMGNAADRPEILLQPMDLLDLFPIVHHLWQRCLDDGQMRMYPGNNIGYYGPYERRFRSNPNHPDPGLAFWVGDRGGVLTLGIESDGTIKADPSLPTDDYAGGNIREKSLSRIIHEADQLTYNDDRGLEHLWGFCRTCEFAEICRGGDTWTSHVFFDRRGNNPYCHHRSLVHAARGVEERLRLAERAAGVPFDNGVFEIDVEPVAPHASHAFAISDVDWPEAWLEADPDLPLQIAAERDKAIEVWRRTRLPHDGSAEEESTRGASAKSVAV